MKSIKLLFLLFVLPLFLAYHHKNNQAPGGHIRKHKVLSRQLPALTGEGLPSTPKGLTLKNHFGADPNDSPYGPTPTLVKKEVSTKYPDGSIVVENQTEIIHLPEGVLSECDITSQKHYPICFNLQTCDLCAANPYCGWCQATQKCLPGKLQASTCAKACFHSWIFNLNSCKGLVFGKMTNVAPEALNLIRVEETEPKIRVNTIITHPAVVKTPVLLGKVIHKNELTKVNESNGEVLRKDTFNWEQPILGEVQQVMDVETHHTQYIGLDSGKRLDTAQTRKSLHGKENFAFREIQDNSGVDRKSVV